MYNIVQYSSKEYRVLQRLGIHLWVNWVNYLGACNGMIFNQCPRDKFNALGVVALGGGALGGWSIRGTIGEVALRGGALVGWSVVALGGVGSLFW